ncbi:MAG TPA: TetR family transcriptional regulator C-terminal domain-containing protein [Ensifer sp.]|jgi:AcrR family transcriptional regulator|uniref:TetR/AcrR family transcriptional regulator n=1 Tax=Ensifer sp. TaxID=1872086 RepID=UPI002E14337F|nr:TetR family transcriptional regulator C-terminal domain-containing protein [Ensifer sp.]
MPKPFKRAPESERRRELVEATLDCIAELGIQATSLRAVAAKAGVTNGLIRHHFVNKANLIVAAYRRATEMMMAPAMAVLTSSEGSPHQRLASLVRVTLGNEETDYRLLALWATFISQSPVDPMIAAVRDENYDILRQATEQLIAEVFKAEDRRFTASDVARATIEVHALLDGFWIAVCLETERSKTRGLAQLGLDAVAKILAIRLADDSTA